MIPYAFCVLVQMTKSITIHNSGEFEADIEANNKAISIVLSNVDALINKGITLDVLWNTMK